MSPGRASHDRGLPLARIFTHGHKTERTLGRASASPRWEREKSDARRQLLAGRRPQPLPVRDGRADERVGVVRAVGAVETERGLAADGGQSSSDGYTGRRRQERHDALDGAAADRQGDGRAPHVREGHGACLLYTSPSPRD